MTSPTPDVLLVGPVTWDLFDDGHAARRPGGAVSYAARVCTALGVRARVLTTAADDADFAAFESHDLHVVPSAETLTFHHALRDSRRVLQLRSAAPPTLRAVDLPLDWSEASTTVIGPLLPDDLDLRSFRSLAPRREGLLAQGLQRYIGRDGTVHRLPRPSESLFEHARPTSTISLSAGEVSGWSEAHFASIRARAERLIVTRGPDGADIYEGDEARHLAALPAEALDPTGAGDSFATAFVLTLDEGLERAAWVAAAVAAAVVGTVGPLALPTLDELTGRFAPCGSSPP